MTKNLIIANVVTFNRLDLLKKVVNALRIQTRKPDRIVIVDNSSTDGTAEWLEQQQDLTVVRQPNSGSSGGQYTGVKTAYELGADYVWTMDDDILPDRACLENLEKYARPDIILCALRKHPDGRVFFNEMTRVNLENPFKKIWPKLFDEEDMKHEIFPIKTFTFEGPFFPRKVIEEIGLPDKKFFIYADDTEYSLRALREGFSIFMIRDAVMQKMLPVPDNREFSWKHYYVIRNMIALDVMYGNLPVRFLRPFAYLFNWLNRSRNIDNVMTTLRAFIDGYDYRSGNLRIKSK